MRLENARINWNRNNNNNVSFSIYPVRTNRCTCDMVKVTFVSDYYYYEHGTETSIAHTVHKTIKGLEARTGFELMA